MPEQNSVEMYEVEDLKAALLTKHMYDARRLSCEIRKAADGYVVVSLLRQRDQHGNLYIKNEPLRSCIYLGHLSDLYLELFGEYLQSDTEESSDENADTQLGPGSDAMFVDGGGEIDDPYPDEGVI